MICETDASERGIGGWAPGHGLLLIFPISIKPSSQTLLPGGLTCSVISFPREEGCFYCTARGISAGAIYFFSKKKGQQSSGALWIVLL